MAELNQMAMQNIRVGAVLGVTLTMIVVTVLAASLLTAYQSVPNNGEVKSIGVEVYWDSDCTNNVTSIDWGFLQPGATVNKTVYIKNGGNIPMILNLTTVDWAPVLASNNLLLNWDRENYVVNTTVPVASAVLTLSVLPDISGVSDFSFDIVITGTEYA